MPPPRASSAENSLTAPAAIAATVQAFLQQHPQAALLEDGKVLFEQPQATIAAKHELDRCLLQAWNQDRNFVRSVASLEERGARLRLATMRFGREQTKLVELVSKLERAAPNSRSRQRAQYAEKLELLLQRTFDGWKPEGFRSSMDLERSFGPAYARGWMSQGSQAWAVVGASEHESSSTLDGILAVGILWLEHCRKQSEGKRLFRGLRVILPQGGTMLTQTRMAWLNPSAAEWQLWEMSPEHDTLTPLDPADTGNFAMKLIHRPDEERARERFSTALETVYRLIEPSEHSRIEPYLRSSAEMAFLLHGFEFGRARIRPSATGFAHELSLSFGTGDEEVELSEDHRPQISSMLADLFARRRPPAPTRDFSQRRAMTARISPQAQAAHRKTPAGLRRRLPQYPAQDPLYRALPERWLESELRQKLAPISRSLALSAVAPTAPPLTPPYAGREHSPRPGYSRESNTRLPFLAQSERTRNAATRTPMRLLPHFDERWIYSQVPVIAGQGERGMLDLLGVTMDGRLAVLELKASEDMHFALQGLDYWIRVRAQHRLAANPQSGLGEFQQHGYFHGAQLSAENPRLFLIAPALHIHPATETVLRYLSPEVEWQLLALDERWRETLRVTWRRSGGGVLAPRR